MARILGNSSDQSVNFLILGNIKVNTSSITFPMVIFTEVDSFHSYSVNINLVEKKYSQFSISL